MSEVSDENDHPKWKDAIISLGHCFLLADMCFFAAATLNAHLHYMESLDTTCKNINKLSVTAWTSVGYSLRIIFSLWFFSKKFSNLYKFISRVHLYPRIGVLQSPIMSTLLLSVIVYDFRKCEENSNLFTVNSARLLLSWYSMSTILLVAGLGLLHVISYLKRRDHKNRVFVIFRTSFWLILVIGCSVGVVAGLEMVKNQKITLFTAFDLYSFFISLVALLVGIIIQFKNRFSHRISPVSSL